MHLTVKIYPALLLLLYAIQVSAQPAVARLGSSDAIVLDINVDENKKQVIASTENQVQVWNYASSTLLNSWDVRSILAIDVHNNLLVGVSRSGSLHVWDLESGTALHSHNICSAALLCVAWLDHMSVAVGSEDGALYKINFQTGEIVNIIKNNSPITALSCGFNSALLVGDSKGEIKIYDASDFTLTKSIKAHASWIREIHINDSSNHFVTASDDKRLKRWHYTNLVEISKFREKSWVLSCDYFPPGPKDPAISAVGTLSGDIRIITAYGTYNAKSNASINKIVLLKHELPLLRVITGTHGRGIEIRDASSMKMNSN